MQNIMVEATDYFTLGHEITVVLDEEQRSAEYLRGYNKEHFEKTNKKQIVYVFDAENPGKEFHGMVTAMIEYEGSGEMKLIATPCEAVVYLSLIHI